MRFLSPAGDEMMLQAQMIQHAGNDSVDDFLHRLRACIKCRVGGQNRGAGEDKQFEILNVNQVQGRLTRDKNQFFLFLKDYISSAQQNILAIAMSDAAQGAHAAWNDDHGIRGIGAAGKRRVHALKIMRSCSRWKTKTSRQFLSDDHLGIIAQHDVDFMLFWVKIIEQPLGI